MFLWMLLRIFSRVVSNFLESYDPDKRLHSVFLIFMWCFAGCRDSISGATEVASAFSTIARRSKIAPSVFFEGLHYCLEDQTIT